MGRFTKITENAFKEFQLEAGLILHSFNIESPEVTDEDIVCTTTGGIQITCKPTYTDYGSDIDNVPANMLELKNIDGWECSLGFTALSVTPAAISLALGAADLDSAGGFKTITPRAEKQNDDATDIWWVGDRADGGLVACCLKNALSTDGLSLKTTKNGKGQLSCTLTGHVSITAQDVVPMEFYVMEGAAE
jgi:hypothetical protein